MKRKSYGMAKGIGLGMVAGIAAGVIGQNLLGSKNVKRKITKAADAVGDFVGNVQNYIAK